MVRINPRVREIPSMLKPTSGELNRIGKAVDAAFRKEVDQAFKSEGASTGPRWKPLSPQYERRKLKLFAGAQMQTISTARSRGETVPTGRKQRSRWVTKKLGSAGTILQLTGDMMRAFTKSDPTHLVNSFNGPKGPTIQIGAIGPAYWGWHQDGGPKPGHPPARPIVRWNPPFREALRVAALDVMTFMVAQRIRAMMHARFRRVA